MGRFFLILALAGVLAGAGVWYFGLPGDNPTLVNAAHGGSQPKVTPEALGDWLYPQKEMTHAIRVHQVRKGVDSIVIPGNLVEIDKVDVGTTNPGEILYVGEGVPEGAAQLAGIAPFMQDSYLQASVTQGGRSIVKFYRPLRKSSEVSQGQMVGEIDPARALNNFLMKQAKVVSAEEELLTSEEIDKEARRRLETEIKINSSFKEIADAKLTMRRTWQEFVKAREELVQAKIELDSAKILMDLHEIRIKHPLRRGFIKTIYRDTGEPVKELEPVLQIYSIDRLMAEAFVEPQYLGRLRANMMATIEPVQDETPLRTFEGHRRAPITSVSFVTLGKNLYVVSSAEDGFLKIWGRDVQGSMASRNLGEMIKAAAGTPRGAQQPQIVAGTAEGKIHLFNLVVDKDGLPNFVPALQKPLDAHRDAVTALAFSPDGKHAASGAADGTIKLWNAAEGTLIYAFDAAHGADNPHQGAITSLTFTPQSRLVSASRDNTLRVWNLKAKGAHLEGDPITSRSGNVNQLGVSQDGRWMLFDQGKALQLMTLPDGQTVNSLKNPGGSTPFETLALFSPDANLILTGGAPEGRLQLWRAPSDDGRAYEVRQFVTDQRQPVTCAAFAPALEASGESAYAASGTKDGNVYLWPVPSKQDVDKHRIQNVPVRVFSRTTEVGSRHVRFGVEVPNLDGRLLPGRPVTIVME